MSTRRHGLSAFVRCKNEQEYIRASLLSISRVCDEIVVILNNSTDGTRGIVTQLADHLPKIKVLDFPDNCSPIGPGYIDRVKQDPRASLARYYNWCTAQTAFSHVCKWDGDMIATPEVECVRSMIGKFDVVCFDGYDVLGRRTTDMEPRIFRYDESRARYADWDLYEVLQHDYSRVACVATKCYLHMKLAKADWVGKEWENPNDSAERAVPQVGAQAGTTGSIRALIRRVLARARATLSTRSS